MKNYNLSTNPYYILGGLIGKEIDSELIMSFVEKYIQLSQKDGKRKDDIISTVKKFSIELNDALLNSCVTIQSVIENKNEVKIELERVSVKEAAEIFAISPVTIRNWINDKKNPLVAKNFGIRKTSILLKDLNNYMYKLGKQVKLKA